MSEAETSSSRIEKVKKPRPAMSEAQRAGLAKGRARLAASRQAVKDRTMAIEEDPINAVTRKPAKKPQRVIVEDDNGSDSEPEIHVIRRRTKKPTAKVSYHSEDEESEEEEAPVSKRTPARAPAPVRRATARPSRARAVTPPPEEEPFTVHFF